MGILMEILMEILMHIIDGHLLLAISFISLLIGREYFTTLKNIILCQVNFCAKLILAN